MAALSPRCGGKAVGTPAPRTRGSWPAAVGDDRPADRVARRCHRLPRRVQSAPRGGQRNEPIEGLPALVPRGVRVVTVLACGRRRARAPAPAGLPKRPPAPQPQRPARPPAERLLHACAGVSLTLREQATGEASRRRMTPWSGGQEASLPRLGVGDDSVPAP